MISMLAQKANFMVFMSSISSYRPSIFELPKEVLTLTCGYLNDPKDVVHFASTNKKFHFLASNDPLSAPLWNLLLRKNFPSSCTRLKRESESLDFYKYLASIERNMKNGEYRLQTLNEPQNLKACLPYPITTLILWKGQLICASLYDGTIYICNPESPEEPQVLKGHQNSISCIKIFNDKLVSSSWDGSLKIWDLNTRRELTGLNGLQNYISCIKIVKDKLISGAADGTIKIWNLNKIKERALTLIDGHQSAITCMKVVEDKLISSSFDGVIKIWHLNNAEEGPQTLRERHVGSIRMCIQKDKLISHSWENGIKILDLHDIDQKPQALNGPFGPTNSTTCIKVKEGKLVAGASNGRMKIWDLNNGQKVQELIGHNKCIKVIKIVDKFIISGASDGTITIWDLETGQELQKLDESQGFMDNIECIKIVDGKIFSSSANGKIKIWDFTPLLPDFKNVEKTSAHAKFRENSLEAVLNIATKEEYSQQLQCTPDFLPKIGICSSADLQVVWDFNSHNFQHLQITDEKITDDYIQLQANAFNKKEAIVELLDQLWSAAEQKSQKATQQCSVIRNENGIVKEARNPWIDFPKKLNHLQGDLFKNTQTRRALLNTFSKESYPELVKEVNALIDEFHALERKTLMMRLYSYVNQWCILRKWNHLRDQGVTSLSALFQQNKMTPPQDIFNMGE
jgi:WD40 repeat protein